jgi:transposase
MDNASIHKGAVVELLVSMGVVVLFTPPYSPWFNPVEEAFAQLKKVDLTFMNLIQ